MSKVVITHCPLSINSEEVFSMASEDKILIESINRFSNELLEKGIEIFDRNSNIIVTEQGYYCAFWDDDLIFD